MALIVEDGSVVAGAESYCSVAFADAYHAARGNTSWDALDATDQKEPALRKATEYMMQMYRGRWKGYRVSDAQVLDWPRANVEVEGAPYGALVPNDSVPEEVKKVCAELALRAVSATLAPDLTTRVLSETVGPISVTYDANSPQQTRYASLDAWLSVYFQSSGPVFRLARA